MGALTKLRLRSGTDMSLALAIKKKNCEISRVNYWKRKRATPRLSVKLREVVVATVDTHPIGPLFGSSFWKLLILIPLKGLNSQNLLGHWIGSSPRLRGLGSFKNESCSLQLASAETPLGRSQQESVFSRSWNWPGFANSFTFPCHIYLGPVLFLRFSPGIVEPVRAGPVLEVTLF